MVGAVNDHRVLRIGAVPSIQPYGWTLATSRPIAATPSVGKEIKSSVTTTLQGRRLARLRQRPLPRRQRRANQRGASGKRLRLLHQSHRQSWRDGPPAVLGTSNPMPRSGHPSLAPHSTSLERVSHSGAALRGGSAGPGGQLSGPFLCNPHSEQLALSRESSRCLGIRCSTPVESEQ